MISNERASSVTDVAGGKHHTFPQTPALSTYIFALMAGPYDHYEDKFTYPDGKEVPLGIYCRKTMSKFLDYQELFTITKQARRRALL